MAIVTVGIDLAKNVFAVHGVDESGKPALVRPEVPRAKLLELIANLPTCHAASSAWRRVCYATLRDNEPFGEGRWLSKKANRESFAMPA